MMELVEHLIYGLYFDEEKTQREIAKELGIERQRIVSMFREKGWKSRPAAPRREEVNPDEVYKLYFQDGLSQREIAEKLGLKGSSPIMRIFKEQGWKSRGRWGKTPTRTIFSSPEERKAAKKERKKRNMQRLKEMRERLFGTECKICGVSTREKTLAVHRKDFKEHRQNKLWIKGELESVNPENWVSLCVACHRGVHWMHKQYGADWKDIEQYLQNQKAKMSKEKEWYKLSYEEKETKRNGIIENETISELRKRLFGEECNMCGSDSRKLVIHRKDGRPHDRNFLRSRENLEAIDTKEWVLLCQKCHRYVHWVEEKLGLNWQDFEKRKYEH